MRGTAEHPDFEAPITYDVQALPESGYGQVSSTINMMRRYANEDAKSPILVQRLNTVLEAARSQVFAGVEPCTALLGSVFAEAKEAMRFQLDATTGGAFDPNVVEVLVRPVDVVLLSENGAQVPGDCDCFSMYVAAMLVRLGVPCAFVTIAADGSNPESFSHVYVVAYPNSGDRTVMDASHGPYPGWEAPNVGRYKEWPLGEGDGGACGPAGILMLLLAVAGIWWVCKTGGRLSDRLAEVYT